MNIGLWGAAIGVAVVGGIGIACTAGAYKLFNRVIPRQDVLRVNLDEMADMAKWEEYKKMITPRIEWLNTQPLEYITIKSRDGLTLQGYYLASKGESQGIVLCHHGYTSSGLKDCVSIAKFFYEEMGYDFLLVDNRAHGKSEGEYIGFGILDRYDCLEWVNYLNKRFNNKNILLYGVSMGASTVLMTAGFEELSGKNVKAIISDCAFTSPYDVFSHILKRDYHLPSFPIMNINNALSRKKAGYGFKDYSTIEAVRKTNIPILFIHGSEDDFVPTQMSRENYENCRSPKDILIVENAAHAASYYENPKLYEEKIKAFLSKYIG